MLRLLLATRNRHKAREIGDMLRGLPLRIATLDEFPNIPEVEEDGKTLEENARKKAVHAVKGSGLWAIPASKRLKASAFSTGFSQSGNRATSVLMKKPW